MDYAPFVSGLPRDIRIASSSAGKAAVSLNLRVQAVQTNVDLNPAMFRVTIPDGATTISLEELRQAGPLGEEATHGSRMSRVLILRPSAKINLTLRVGPAGPTAFTTSGRCCSRSRSATR